MSSQLDAARGQLAGRLFSPIPWWPLQASHLYRFDLSRALIQLAVAGTSEFNWPAWPEECGKFLATSMSWRLKCSMYQCIHSYNLNVQYWCFEQEPSGRSPWFWWDNSPLRWPCHHLFSLFLLLADFLISLTKSILLRLIKLTQASFKSGRPNSFRFTNMSFNLPHMTLTQNI